MSRSAANLHEKLCSRRAGAAHEVQAAYWLHSVRIFDADIRGFAVCIYRGGGQAFTFDYRVDGRQRRMTIARWPEWSVTAARERARELRRMVDAGGDPLGERSLRREAPRFQDLIDRYIKEHVPRLAPVSASVQKSMLAKLVAPH